MIQHEYSIYSLAWFPLFLFFLRMLDQNTTLVIHTVAPKKGLLKTAYIVLFHSWTGFLCTRIVVHTEESRQKFLRTTLCNAGVEVVPLANAAPARHKPRKFDAKKVELLCFGFLTPEKGFDVAIDAVKGLKNARLTVAGDVYPVPKQKDLDFKKLLKEKSRGVKNVRFVNKFLSDEKRNKLFEKTDFFLLPYRSISQSAVLSEAWSNGKIPVCSDLPAFREEIGNDKYGVLFRTGDAGDLRKKIEELVRNGKKREKVLANVKRLAKQRSFEALAKRYLQWKN